MEASGNGYFKTACDYVHLNPVRAKLLSPSQRLREFRWSSFPQYVKSPGARPPWLRVDRLLGEHGIPGDTAAGRAELERHLELRRAAEDPEAVPGWLSDWCLGSEAFRQELLAQVEPGSRREDFGAEIRESAVEKALRLLQADLQRLGWSDTDLAQRRKGDAQKLALARHLRQETTMTLEWIAAQLHMGTKTYLAHLLYWQGRQGASS